MNLQRIALLAILIAASLALCGALTSCDTIARAFGYDAWSDGSPAAP